MEQDKLLGGHAQIAPVTRIWFGAQLRNQVIKEERREVLKISRFKWLILQLGKTMPTASPIARKPLQSQE